MVPPIAGSMSSAVNLLTSLVDEHQACVPTCDAMVPPTIAKMLSAGELSWATLAAKVRGKKDSN